MEKYVVWNVAGLNKFTRWEVVLTDWVVDCNWEVRVYKTDCDWDFLLNERGNKVSYSILFNRLKPTNIENLQFTAGTLEQRVMNRTFTDKALDKATDYIVTVNEFNTLIIELRNKLWEIFDKLNWKINALTISSDAYDAEKFKDAMEEMDWVVKFFSDKRMETIKELHDKLITSQPKEKFNPETILE
jgi:hypothetical protein